MFNFSGGSKVGRRRKKPVSLFTIVSNVIIFDWIASGIQIPFRFQFMTIELFLQGRSSNFIVVFIVIEMCRR